MRLKLMRKQRCLTSVPHLFNIIIVRTGDHCIAVTLVKTKYNP